MNIKKISLIVMLLIISILYVSCGSSNEVSDNAFNKDMSFELDSSNINTTSVSNNNNGFNDSQNITDNIEESSEKNDSFDYGNRKIIKQGNLTIETLDYEKSYNDLTTLIKNTDGYIEDITEHNNNYNNKKLKQANISIRVPKGKYDLILEESSILGYIVQKNSSVQDVSDKYFDTEARLNSLTIQEERLLTLLKKTDNLSHIIELEDKLASTRYQIENLTGTLKKYDNLIAYSTLTIELIEVEEAKIEEPTQKENLRTRINHNFKSSFNSAKKTAESFILFIALKSIQILLSIFIIIIIIIAITISDKKIKNKTWSKNKVINKKKTNTKKEE